LEVDPSLNLFIVRLARSLVIVAIFLALARLIDLLAPSSNRLFAITGMAIQERLLPFYRTAFKLIAGAIALVIIIQEWGYDVTGLIAGLGLGGLAVSLAARDTIENLFGFSAIVGDSPFIVGEVIKTGDIEGTVERVGIRSTRIRQLDQSLVTIPNSKLVGAPVLNWSRLSRRWVNFTLRIPRTISHSQMEHLLEQLRLLLKEREHVDADSVLVRFVNFGETALEVLVRAYITLPEWGDFTAEKEAINLDILKLLEELNIVLA
jgi:MscS family membrane protein